MYPLHLWHVVDDVQAARRHEAHARAVCQQAVRAERARRHASGTAPRGLRQALAFTLIEAGLRLLTPRPEAQVRRAR